MQAIVHEEYQALQQTHWWFRARREIFETVLDKMVELPEPRAARILDLGPGSGVNVPILAPRGRLDILDLSLGSLEHCRKAGASGNLLLADATIAPLRDHTYDLVTALDILEHLEDDAGALARWRSLLHSQGRLLLTVPALRSLWGRQDILAGHVRRYRRKEVAQRLQGAGFEIERLTYFNTILFPPILAVRLAMRPFLRKTTTAAEQPKSSDLSMPSFGLSNAFRRMFSAEKGWLVKRNLPFGVSLLAIARPTRTRQP